MVTQQQTNLEDDDIQECSDVMSISFNKKEQLERSDLNKPRLALLEELKVAFVAYLKECRPDALDCQVENYLISRGHKILWTPPNCPDLQPIERYWACGKNHVSLCNYKGIKMKETVHLLREGWYKNQGTHSIEHPLEKKPVNCGNLWKKCIEYASSTFINLCHGFDRQIGALNIDPNYDRGWGITTKC